MEPVSLIVAAVAAGATAGAEGSASEAVKDAYAGLKALLKRRLSGRASAEVALERHETRPEAWQGALEAQLTESGANRDPALVSATEQLMALLDDASATRTARYQVDARGAQGVQIGDHGTQINTFGAPPAL